MKIQNKFLIDGIQSAKYEKLIFKNKKDIKGCCPRLLKNILIAVNQVLFAIFHGERATPKSLAQHGFKHIQKNHLSQDQLDDVKTIIAYAIAHMKNGNDKDQLNEEFAALIKKSATGFSKTKNTSSESEPSKISTPTPQLVPPDPATNPKFWDTAPPHSLLSSIDSFLNDPSAATALAPEDQGYVFHVAATRDKVLTDEHLKYLREADTFCLDGTQNEAFIQKVFDNCKNITFVLIERAPNAAYFPKLLEQWKKNLPFLMKLNPKQPFICVLKKSMRVHTTFYFIAKEDTTKLLAKLNDSSREMVIKNTLEFGLVGDSAEVIQQFIQDQPLDSILPLTEDLMDHLAVLKNLIEIRHSSIAELRDILNDEPIEIVDEITKHAMQFHSDKDAEENMALIAYQTSRDLIERGSQTLETVLNQFASTSTRDRFFKKLLKAPQNLESISTLLEILKNAKYPLDNMVSKVLKFALQVDDDDATEEVFRIFFQNFERFQGQGAVSNFELVLESIVSEEQLLPVLKAIGNNLSVDDEKTVLKWIVEGSSNVKIPLATSSIHNAIQSASGGITSHYLYAYNAELRQDFTTGKAMTLRSMLLNCKSKEEVKQLFEDNLPEFVPETDYDLFFEEMLKNCPSSEFEAMFQLLFNISDYKKRVARFVAYASAEQTDIESFFAILKKYLLYYATTSEETDFIFYKIIPVCSTPVLVQLEDYIPLATSNDVVKLIRQSIEDEKELDTR